MESLGAEACRASASGAVQVLGPRSHPGRRGMGEAVLNDQVGAACPRGALEMAPSLHLGALQLLAFHPGDLEGVWPHVLDSHRGSSSMRNASTKLRCSEIGRYQTIE